jgi:hypothetical protein
MSLYLAFIPATSQGVDAVYRFDLSGPGGGAFTVVVRDGDCRISIGPVDETPDVVYEMEASTWMAMAQGRATGDEAVLLGKLRIRGDVELGRRFNDFFMPQGNPPTAREKAPLAGGLRAGWRLVQSRVRASSLRGES